MSAGTRKDGLPFIVAEKIRAKITDGSYAVGERLPAEPDFADQLGVSRSTLREGLKLLEGDGLVVRRQRAGTTVVRRPVLEHPLQQNFAPSELIESAGKEHGIEGAEIRFEVASPEVSSALELEEDSQVVSLERTRMADKVPVIREVNYIDARIVEKASAPLLPSVPFYSWLHDHCGLSVTHGVACLSAQEADGRVAETLEMRDGAPVFVLRQIDFSSGGRPILYSTEFHVPHAFDITVVRNGPYSG